MKHLKTIKYLSQSVKSTYTIKQNKTRKSFIEIRLPLAVVFYSGRKHNIIIIYNKEI